MSAMSDGRLDLATAVPTRGAIVWLLQGARLGDNQQVLALGAALEARFGWKLVVKQLKFERGPVPGSDPKDGIRHVKRAESDPIFATPDDPWPHVVIAIGRRAAPVARWVAALRWVQGYCLAQPIGLCPRTRTSRCRTPAHYLGA